MPVHRIGGAEPQAPDRADNDRNPDPEHRMSVTQQTSPPPTDRRRRERAFIAACAAVAVVAVIGTVLLLTGGDQDTTGSDSPPSVAPTSDSPDTPAPATPQDLAAEAARERYTEYLEVTDQVAQDGYADPERFRSVAVDPELTQLFLTARRLAGVRTTGDTEVASLTVQSVELDAADSYPTVRLLACLDVSKVTAVDANGESVIAADRLDRTRSEVVLQDVPPGAFPDDPNRAGWYVSELVQRGEPC